MVKLSLCMIVKDEERVLGRCLESVKDCVDEIVIADTGSTDQTVEIAKTYTDKVFCIAWKKDFSAARNFTLSKATGEYILWLDADDVVENGNQERLHSLKKMLSHSPYDMVWARYETPFNADTPPLSYERERIFKNSEEFRFQGFIHECVPPKGKIFHSDLCITHRPIQKQSRTGRNLEIYRFHLEKGEALSARDRFYYARELYDNGFFFEAEGELQSFLTHPDGWHVNKIEATKYLCFCRLKQSDFRGALSALFSSFVYGEPRAHILCEIAHIYTLEKRFDCAAFWYEAALLCSSKKEEGDFENEADFSLTPLLGLSYCYYQTGKLERSKKAHERLKTLYPNHPSVLYNERFFSTVQEKSQEKHS